MSTYAYRAKSKNELIGLEQGKTYTDNNGNIFYCDSRGLHKIIQEGE